MRKEIQIKTIRNLNLDHPGGKCRILTIRGGNEEVNPPRMVKIQHFPPGWSRFRFLMVLIQYCLLISPPDGQDSAQIPSKFQLQFLRLMALPVIEESSYLGLKWTSWASFWTFGEENRQLLYLLGFAAGKNGSRLKTQIKTFLKCVTVMQPAL